MATEEERCAEAKKFQRIDDAFRKGDLERCARQSTIRGGTERAHAGHRRAVPGLCDLPQPSCLHPHTAGNRRRPECSVNDGFPPLIAALSCVREAPGATRRTDVDDIFGCSCRLARTRISAASTITRRSTWPSRSVIRSRSRFCSMAAPILNCERGSTSVETPFEMAEAAGLAIIAAMLARKGKPLRQRLRSGLTLLVDMPGTGELVRRQHNYLIRLRLWLNRGEAVRWQTAWGPVGIARLEDNGETLINRSPNRPAVARQRPFLWRRRHANRRNAPAGNRAAYGLRR